MVVCSSLNQRTQLSCVKCILAAVRSLGYSILFDKLMYFTSIRPYCTFYINFQLRAIAAIKHKSTGSTRHLLRIVASSNLPYAAYSSIRN